MGAKYINFFNELTTAVNSLDAREVKLAIGDSTNNNRTLTVKQVVRFLTSNRNRRLKRLGNSLLAVNNIIGNDVFNSRNNNRTDALDINEFINFYTEVVIGAGEYTHTIGRSVSLAA